MGSLSGEMSQLLRCRAKAMQAGEGKMACRKALSSLARVSTGSMASVADEASSVRDQGGTSVTAVATIGQPTFSKCLWQFRWSKSFTVKADEEEALQEGK